MKVKCSRSFIVTVLVLVLVLVGGRLWYEWNKEVHAYVKGVAPEQQGGEFYVRHIKTNSPVPAAPVRSNHVPQNLGLRESAMEMSEAEKAEMTNLFATKLKPAAEKWALVYSNRVPFNLADLTPGKLVGRHGWKDSRFDSYVFVMGDITFGIEIFHGDTHVNYLASKQGMGALNSMPRLAEAPDLSMPVTAQQVLDLVESDCGQRFPPNEILMTPTGQSGALSGGVDAEVGKEASNPDYRLITTTSTDVSMVIGKDGKLVTYLRTP